jgi:protein import protein ZIM17
VSVARRETRRSMRDSGTCAGQRVQPRDTLSAPKSLSPRRPAALAPCSATTTTTTMLPSRLFKNTGIPHYLRSLLVPSPTLPPNVAVQLRLRLGVIRNNSSLTTPPPAPPSSTARPQTGALPPSDPSSAPSNNVQFKLDVEPRLQITFTCTVPDCGTRSTHEFSKRSYTSGIVLIECPGCKNRCA